MKKQAICVADNGEAAQFEREQNAREQKLCDKVTGTFTEWVKGEKKKEQTKK